MGKRKFYNCFEASTLFAVCSFICQVTSARRHKATFSVFSQAATR